MPLLKAAGGEIGFSPYEDLGTSAYDKGGGLKARFSHLGCFFSAIDLAQEPSELRAPVDRVEALAAVVARDNVQVALPETVLRTLALGIPPGVLVADDPGMDAVNEFGLLADAPFGRFDPDPVPVADAQFLGRLAVDLHQGIRIEFPKLGDLVVLGVEKKGNGS